MEHLDHINSEHYYDIEHIDNNGIRRTATGCISNLINSGNREQMKTDLASMFRLDVVDYNYRGSNFSGKNSLI